MVLKNLSCIKLLVALLVLVFVMPGSVAYSQRIIRELESNAGNDFMRGMEGDSIASNRDNEDEDEDEDSRYTGHHPY